MVFSLFRNLRLLRMTGLPNVKDKDYTVFLLEDLLPDCTIVADPMSLENSDVVVPVLKIEAESVSDDIEQDHFSTVLSSDRTVDHVDITEQDTNVQSPSDACSEDASKQHSETIHSTAFDDDLDKLTLDDLLESNESSEQLNTSSTETDMKHKQS